MSRTARREVDAVVGGYFFPNRSSTVRDCARAVRLIDQAYEYAR